MPVSRRASLTALTACCALICSFDGAVYGANIDWNNTGTDYNVGTSWVGGVVPGVGNPLDIALFPNAPGTNPNLSASAPTIAAFRFTSATPGYTLSGNAGTVLTVTGAGTSLSAALYSGNTTGTDTISANVVMGGALGAVQSIAASTAGNPGGNLTISGNITSTNTLASLSLTGSTSSPGSVTLTGNNSWLATTTLLQTATVNVGSNTALSSGAVATAQGSSTIDAVGADRTLTNSLTLGSGNALTFVGTNSLAFGAFTVDNNNTKVFNNNSAAGKTLSFTSVSNTTDTNRQISLNASGNGKYSLGSLALASSGATAIRTFTIGSPTGSPTIDVTGAITNGGGGFNQNLTYSGTGTLTLSGTGSTYSGATSISAAGTLVGIGANAFGSTSGIAMVGTSTLSLRGDASTSFVKASDSTSYTITTSGSGATFNVNQATVAGTGAKTMTIGAISTTSVAAPFTLNFTGANNTGLTVGAFTSPVSTAAANVTLNNTNTTGTTTIASFTSGNSSGGATLIIDGTGNTTITGAITPSGTGLAVTKKGAGTATFTGTSTYASGTTVQDGTLVLGTGASMPAANTFTLGSSTGPTSGVLQLGNGGGAVNTSTPSLTVAAGAGSANAVVGGDAAVSTLTTTNAGAVTYSGKLGGAGTNQNNLALDHNGSGALTLTGTNTYTGTTKVTGSGTLVVSGSISNSAMTVNSGGTLKGSGSVATTTIDSGATLAPGTSIGTLTFGAGSTLTLAGNMEIEYDGTGLGTIDLANAAGAAVDISAGSLSFLPANVNPLTAPAYVFVNYGTLVGTPSFGSVSGLPAGYNIDYAYNGGTSIALVVAAVPEASALLTVGVVGLASISVVQMRRRRDSLKLQA